MKMKIETSNYINLDNVSKFSQTDIELIFNDIIKN